MAESTELESAAAANRARTGTRERRYNETGARLMDCRVPIRGVELRSSDESEEWTEYDDELLLMLLDEYERPPEETT